MMKLEDCLTQNAADLAIAEAAAIKATSRLASSASPDALKAARDASNLVHGLRAEADEIKKAITEANKFRKSDGFKRHLEAIAEAIPPTEVALERRKKAATGVADALDKFAASIEEYRLARRDVTSTAGIFTMRATMFVEDDDLRAREAMGDLDGALSNNFMRSISGALQRALIGVDCVGQHIQFSEWLTSAQSTVAPLEEVIEKANQRLREKRDELAKRAKS